MKHFVLVIVCWFVLTAPAFCLNKITVPDTWPQVKGEHFIVFYSHEGHAAQAKEVLTKAEEQYSRMSYRLGLNTVDDFWTWDKRVNIVLFETAADFTAQTGQPAWSEGFAAQHANLMEERYIVSFFGQQRFITSILPHELGHLILHDLMENKPVPVFFDEGVAQLEEERDDVQFKSIMAALVRQHKHIPFAQITTMRPDKTFNDLQASIFYAESLYIIDFLIKTYGKDNFIKLCRLIRDGSSFNEAVLKAYYPMIQSLDDLERNWIGYLQS